MPIYEYRCPKCGEVVEIMHSMSDDSTRKCEHCGADLERLISRTSFTLKGGGWYKDLYSSAKPSSDGKKSSDSSSGSSGSSSGGSGSGSTSD